MRPLRRIAVASLAAAMAIAAGVLLLQGVTRSIPISLAFAALGLSGALLIISAIALAIDNRRSS